MNSQDIHYWCAIAQFRKFGAVRLKKLYTHFPSMAAAWEASPAQLALAGIESSLAEEFVAFRNTIDPEAVLDELIAGEVHPVTIMDAHYPALLKELYDAPAILFVRGSLEALALPAKLAVVGARRISPYGERITPQLVHPLAAAGICIVSGLALGTDGLAHRAALDVHGVTVAVLGSGVDDASLYPHDHLQLAHEISAGGGAVISELPLGTPPLKQHFPMRNRIISGMCQGTLVIEAAQTSGALITAYAALDQNREVFAVPGPITSFNAAGTNELIKKGARVVTAASDIMDVLQMAPVVETVVPKQSAQVHSPEDLALLDCLGQEPIHIDMVIAAVQRPADQVATALTLLELKGAVKHTGAQQYIKI